MSNYILSVSSLSVFFLQQQQPAADGVPGAVAAVPGVRQQRRRAGRHRPPTRRRARATPALQL